MTDPSPHERDARAGIRQMRDALIAAGLSALLLLALYAGTLAPSVTWWHGGADSGELASAAASLGIPHPTGYPLWVLLGRAAAALPGGDLAGRINLLSAVLAASGGLLAGGAVAALVGGAGRPAATAAGAVAGTLLLGTAPLYWSQAIITEVYALHAALTALALLAWLRPGTHPALRGAAHGLALANHLTSVVVLAAALLAFLPRRPWSPRAALWFALALATPLLLYLLLPVRAAAGPVANWGDPDSPGRFWAHVTGRQYRGYLDPLDAATLRGLPELAGLLARQLPPLAWPLAVAGGWRLARRRPPALRLLLLTVAGTLLFAAAYRSADRAAYLLPAVVALAVLCGVGLAEVTGRALRWCEGRRDRWLALALASGATVLVLAVTVARTGASVSLRGDDGPLRFARATLEALPAGATYYSARDDVTFTLWYAQRVLGLRRDVRVIDVRNPALRGLP